ncbi:nitrate- and nitrite sensing domain-containing protein [Streptomyces sp. NPDC020898]|uniref:sensor histidine kinase n=1 Tax=Streptomyces sp. NPDC020898 TaxID=3365101 RepID=UPI0037A84415
MALHARTAQQQKAPKRQLSLRTILLVLALVPCLVLVALGAMNSGQLYGDWRTVHDRNEQGKRFGTPLVTVFFNLQAERRLTAAALADPKADRSELTRQRGLTDKAVQGLDALAGSTPAALDDAFQQLAQGLGELPDQRTAVDRQTAGQQQTFDAYTDVIAADMALFEDFSNVGFGDTTVLARPALDAQWGLEMLSREDAIIAAGVASGRLSAGQRFQLAEVIGSQEHIYDDKVVPQLPEARAKAYQAVLSGADWKRKTAVEQDLLNTENADDSGRTAVSAASGKEWRQSLDGMTPQLMQASNAYSDDLVSSTEDQLGGLMTDMMVNSAVSLAAVLLMLVISLRLTGILRRRIFALRGEALELQERLPDMVERLRRGEKVDTDAELPEILHGDDELGQLGQALNQARASSLETAVREVELYRGFERLLQRIARRTQLLIGMQLKRLGEMQRRHEDPEVLEGLFDLDHLAARLRRYEENLVILGSGTPQRRWRRPVLLVDILRSAQGEVQDYRRIRIDTDGETWLSERAVGPMVHLLAELMENAVSFSRPPTPVEVTASQVGRGVAVEIEDRGMGMDPEQYAEANELMANPPRMDVMSRADDARLGLYVVARLAANLGLQVELRASSFGGTRVVVLIPGELISGGQTGPSGLVAGQEGEGRSGSGQPVAGQQVPGRSATGQSIDGHQVPGRSATGQSIDGHQVPGRSATGHQTPGRLASEQQLQGQSVDGQQPPGQSIDGQQNQQRLAPGPQIPGQPVDGQQNPGRLAPGPQIPGQPVDGQHHPGRLAPGPQTSGQSVPGPQTPGGTVPLPVRSRPSGGAPDRLAIRGGTGQAGVVDDRVRPGSPPLRAGGEPEGYARPLVGPWVVPSARPKGPSAHAEPQVPVSSPEPLPRRVRQASLASELREPPPSYASGEAPRTGPGAAQPLPRRKGARSGATVGAFQRQSKAARLRPDAGHQPDHQPTHPSPGPDRARKEDGR